MSQEKPEIIYPCEWKYRVIGSEEQSLREAINDVARTLNHRIEHSNQSSGGKYIALVLTAIVDSEAERISIFDTLKSKSAVTMVL